MRILIALLLFGAAGCQTLQRHPAITAAVTVVLGTAAMVAVGRTNHPENLRRQTP